MPDHEEMIEQMTRAMREADDLFMPYQVLARAALDALKAAGHEVVKLPDLVLDEMGAPTWAVEQHWCGRESSPGEVRIRITDKRISATSVSNPNDCPGDARSLAAALLAAANAAEAVSDA